MVIQKAPESSLIWLKCHTVTIKIRSERVNTLHNFAIFLLSLRNDPKVLIKIGVHMAYTILRNKIFFNQQSKFQLSCNLRVFSISFCFVFLFFCRLSPYFRIEGGFSLTSLSFSNKLNPMWPLCSFDLQGKCNDEDCKFQHFIQCQLSQEQMLQDLAAYNPNFTADDKGIQELQEDIESFTKAFAKQYQDKMSWEELCILLVNDVRKSRKNSGPFSISPQPRGWRLKVVDKRQEKFTEESVVDSGRGIVFARKDKIHGEVMQTRETVGNKAKAVSEER